MNVRKPVDYSAMFDHLQEICQPVWIVALVHFLYNARWSAVGQDAVHLPVGSFQAPVFVDGNHENFTMLNALPQKERHGGKVHEVRPRAPAPLKTS